MIESGDFTMASVIIFAAGIILFVLGIVGNMTSTYTRIVRSPTPSPDSSAPATVLTSAESGTRLWLSMVAMLIGAAMVLSIAVQPEGLEKYQHILHKWNDAVGRLVGTSVIPSNESGPTVATYDKATGIVEVTSLRPVGYDLQVFYYENNGEQNIVSKDTKVAIPPGSLKVSVRWIKGNTATNLLYLP